MTQLILLISVLIFVSGCQQKPTTVRETTAPAAVEDPASFAARILNERPIILDVQSPIDFGLSHVPGAINARWEDFTLPGPRKTGALDPDRFAVARRLALWGINPETTVVVVGMGPEGLGEEGRVGWMLRLLGVKKVETGSIRLFRGQIPRENEGRPADKTIWKPVSRDQLEFSAGEFRKLLAEKNVTGNRWVLDVRHFNELKKDALGFTGQVVRGSWRDFYDQVGRGKCSVVDQLVAKGVSAQSEIIIVGEDGVGAAAAGFVLDSCGFGKPRVLSTGLKGLENL